MYLILGCTAIFGPLPRSFHRVCDFTCSMLVSGAIPFWSTLTLHTRNLAGGLDHSPCPGPCAGCGGQRHSHRGVARFGWLPLAPWALCPKRAAASPRFVWLCLGPVLIHFLFLGHVRCWRFVLMPFCLPFPAGDPEGTQNKATASVAIRPKPSPALLWSL